jgi:hypothetical protein
MSSKEVTPPVTAEELAAKAALGKIKKQRIRPTHASRAIYFMELMAKKKVIISLRIV